MLISVSSCIMLEVLRSVVPLFTYISTQGFTKMLRQGKKKEEVSSFKKNIVEVAVE